MEDVKKKALLEDAKKNICGLLEEEWDRVTRFYDESLSEHEKSMDENSKKMVFTVPMQIRLCDTDGKTRADAKITTSLSFSKSATGRMLDGHPELPLGEGEED